MTSPKTQHSMLYGNIRLFAGTASPELAQEVELFQVSVRYLAPLL